MSLRRYAIYEIPEMAAALEHEGCAFVPEILSPHQCAKARDAIDALQPIHWDEVHRTERGGTGRARRPRASS